MQTLIIESIEDTLPQKYPVFIGKGIHSRVHEYFSLKQYSNIVVVADSAVEKTALPRLLKGINRECNTVIMNVVEKNKSFETVEYLCKQFLKHRVDRNSVIINLGGGVLGDTAGFAACIYMRGISFIQAPTTLLAQVDASVGGKVGVNFAGIKNILGSIKEPDAVIIDTETLLTLSDRETLSGFAEVLKHAFIMDAGYLNMLSSRNSNTIEDIIKRSCEIKASVVARDLREAGLRKILNFGHTFGHAFEALSYQTKYPLSHGEAVAIGMIAESKLSVLNGLLKESEFKTIEDSIKLYHLPTRLPAKLNLADVFDLMNSDKKNTGGEIQWTLLERMGKAVVNQTATMENIEESFKYILPE